MASYNSLIILTYLFIISFNFATTRAQDPTSFYCSSKENTTANNSAFQLNLKALFSSLSTSAATTANNNGFFNDTVSGGNSSDTVYGLFMCRGDLSPEPCGQCVGNATTKLSNDSGCSSSKQALIWYDECMVRYSNTSFFSTMETIPGVYMWNTANISSLAISSVPLLLNQTADEAANSLDRYAAKQTNVTGSNQTL